MAIIISAHLDRQKPSRPSSSPSPRLLAAAPRLPQLARKRARVGVHVAARSLLLLLLLGATVSGAQEDEEASGPSSPAATGDELRAQVGGEQARASMVWARILPDGSDHAVAFGPVAISDPNWTQREGVTAHVALRYDIGRAPDDEQLRPVMVIARTSPTSGPTDGEPDREEDVVVVQRVELALPPVGTAGYWRWQPVDPGRYRFHIELFERDDPAATAATAGTRAGRLRQPLSESNRYVVVVDPAPPPMPSDSSAGGDPVEDPRQPPEGADVGAEEEDGDGAALELLDGEVEASVERIGEVRLWTVRIRLTVRAAEALTMRSEVRYSRPDSASARALASLLPSADRWHSGAVYVLAAEGTVRVEQTFRFAEETWASRFTVRLVLDRDGGGSGDVLIEATVRTGEVGALTLDGEVGVYRGDRRGSGGETRPRVRALSVLTGTAN